MSDDKIGTMIAYRFAPPAEQPVAERVKIPSPAADEVLVQVLAGGVCHSDLGLLDPTSAARKRNIPGPFTLGHEGAGTVLYVNIAKAGPLIDEPSAGIITSLGSKVSSTHPELTTGTYVAIYGPNPCFQQSCLPCSRGMTNLCRVQPSYGLGSDGSWAKFTTVHAASVVPVPASPEQIPPGEVAAATDAILTPYHAMKTCCRLQPEHTVLCLGVGGLGANAVAIAKKCLGVRCVIACDTRDLALEGAKAAGADYAVTPGALAEFVAEKELAVDFAFDFVGTQTSFDTCQSIISVGGTIHIVGIGSPLISLVPLAGMVKDITYKTSYWGTKDELAEVLQAVADGLLKPVVETRKMSECAQVLEDMHHGKLRARVALIPE